MSNINLLPWREVRLQRQRKNFILILASTFLLATVLIFFINWVIKQNIIYQQRRNQLLQQEIIMLDTRLLEIKHLQEKRKALLDRVKLIEQLQLKRNLPIRLFNQLSDIVPNGIYLNALSVNNSTVDLNGKTESHGRVANMMRRIDSSGWLGKSTISTIFSSDVTPISLNQFSMMFHIMKEADEKNIKGEKDEL